MSSVNTILSGMNLLTNPASSSNSAGGQSYADWYASLDNALGTAGGSSLGSGTAQFSDQMQALLTQLQAGNLVAPSGASSANTSAVDASSAASAAGQTHHHHHHHGSSSSGSGSADGMLEDIASSLTGNTASSSGSGSDNPFSSNSGLMSGLQSLGSTASAGVKQALQAYAAMHGVQFAQNSTTA